MKPVKCDPELLRLARATLIEKLGPRLEPVMSDFDGHKSVSGFKDPEFVKAFGPWSGQAPRVRARQPSPPGSYQASFRISARENRTPIFR